MGLTKRISLALVIKVYLLLVVLLVLDISNAIVHLGKAFDICLFNSKNLLLQCPLIKLIRNYVHNLYFPISIEITS